VYEEAGVTPTAEVPPGVDAVRRKTEDASFLFLLNHSQEAVEVRLPNPGRDLLTGTEYDSQLILDPLGVAILQEITP
jgi:beta-galactosidase